MRQNKWKGVVGMMLATVLAVGMMNTQAHAAKNETEPEALTIEADGEEGITYDVFADYVTRGILTEAEAQQLVQTYADIDALYAKLPEDASEEALAQADTEAGKIVETIRQLENKINEDDRVQEEAENKLYYAEMVEKQVLTPAEAERLQQVNTQVNALYDQLPAGASEADFAKLDQEVANLQNSIADLEEKIQTHIVVQTEQEEQAFYDNLIQKGVLTPEEVAQVRQVHAQVDALYATITEQTSEETLAEMDKQVVALYDSVAAIEKKYFNE